MAGKGKANRGTTRKRRSRSLMAMDGAELKKATAEFEEEFVADSFGEPTARQKAQLKRAKRKPGRPKIGKGVRVISVSIEQELLSKTDRLAKKLRVKRSELITRGLQAVLDEEMTAES
jgi:alkanesulfonate monooxygenase SsuD/methylene tetrahydromethanopterin reductase-like flavin-dependent oxidoreductase (luciferase family)